MKKFINIAALAVVVLGGAVAVPTAANAAVSCGANLCAFNNANYVGLIFQRSTPGSNNFGTGVNDTTSSTQNKTNKDGAFYENAGLSGPRHCQKAGSSVANINIFDNDSYSSAVLYSGTGYC
jgi:hypothetical protein